MTTITLRIDSDLKQDIQAIAKSLWLSLNQLLNLKIRELREDTEIRVPLNNATEVEFENFSDKEIELLKKQWDFKNLTKRFNNLIESQWI